MAPPRGEGKGGGKGGKGKRPQTGDEDAPEDVGGEGLRRRGQGKGRGKGGKDSNGATPEKDKAGSQLNTAAPDFTPGGVFGQGSYPDATSGPAFWNPWAQPMLPPLWTEYRDKDGEPYYYNAKTGLCQWERPPELEPAKQQSGVEDAIAGVLDKNREGTFGSLRDAEKSAARRGDGDAGKGAGGGKGDKNRGRRRGGGGKGVEDASEFGPPGCNLFVFHLPDDWKDEDLNEYFAPHGAVVSAKVMKELGTGRSRGFGFVSYEDRVSAATAIKKMQGYKILGKRLKVEFKKGEHDGKGEMDESDVLGEDEAGSSKKGYQDDERLIGYLRAISAKNVVQSLKESEDGGGG